MTRLAHVRGSSPRAQVCLGVFVRDAFTNSHDPPSPVFPCFSRVVPAKEHPLPDSLPGERRRIGLRAPTSGDEQRLQISRTRCFHCGDQLSTKLLCRHIRDSPQCRVAQKLLQSPWVRRLRRLDGSGSMAPAEGEREGV